MNKVSELEYVVLTPGDWQDVIDLLQKHFYTRENLRLGAGIDPAEALTPSEEKCIRVGLATGVPVGAREKDTRRLVAVLIGFIITADGQQLFPRDENETEKERRLLRALDLLPKVADMFQEPGVESVLLITRICVHPDHGRRGVASRMVQIIIGTATKRGCQLVFSSTANPHAKKLLLTLGFQTQAIVDFCTQGGNLLDVSRMSYHQALVMTKRLQPSPPTPAVFSI